MLSICGTDCCSTCNKKDACGGCRNADGHPFGGTCIAAECIKQADLDAFQIYKNILIHEFNSLGIKDLKIKELHLLNGSFINLEYQLPNGQSVKFLEDNNVYLGNQVEIPGQERCYGLAADDNYLLVCEYGCDGKDLQIITYQKR